MKKTVILLIVLAIIACSCEDENSVTPPKTVLVTISAEASFATAETDDWIVVHDEDGTMLSFRHFENNETFVLESDKPVLGKIGVTMIRHANYRGVDHFNVNSYLDIEKGKTIIFDSDVNSFPAVTGELNVSVSDVQSLAQSSLTCKLGSSGSGGWSDATEILDLKTSTYTGVSKYLVSISDGSSLKYKILDNVQADDSYFFSFLEMLPFDHEVNFTFPTCDDAALFINASDMDVSNDRNDYAFLAQYTGTHSNFTAGYLNSFTNYRTRLTLTYADYGYEYINYGSIPTTNFTWPLKTDFLVTGTSISNFSATVKKPFDWRISTWSYGNATTLVTWNIAGSTTQHTLSELPSEILSQYPALSFTNQIHSSTVFYTASIPYVDYINSVFGGEWEPEGLRLGIRIPTK